MPVFFCPGNKLEKSGCSVYNLIMILKELCAYYETLLGISAIPDISLNGLQVGNTEAEIRTVAFAVDAAFETIEKAADADADLLFVHHGIFWGKAYAVTGSVYRRFETLIRRPMALFAAHLPLDLHPTLGNNAQIASQLGLTSREPFGEYKGLKIGYKGVFPQPRTIDDILASLSLSRSDCLKVYDFGKEKIASAAVVSGGAVDELSQAVDENLDLYITGDAGHEVYHFCKESKINMLSIGHYASETYGIKAVAAQTEKDLNLKTVFIDCPTGL